MAEIQGVMTFGILLKREGANYVAHCLELDIVAVGKTANEAARDLDDLIATQVDYAFSNDNLDNLYHPAPANVWAEFYRCTNQKAERINVPNEFGNEAGFVPPEIMANTCCVV